MSDHDHAPDDPLPALVAEIDQMVAIAPHFARGIRGIFDAYRDEGFTEAQALYLTVSQFKDTPGQPPA